MRAPTSEFLTPDAASGGFILVAVLWILGTLSALVSIYAVYVINTAAGLTVHDDRLRAEALTSAALELTADRILSATKESGPIGGRFEFRLSAARVDVEYQPENARVDLNAAPKPLIVGLFSALGSQQRDAEIYGDRIVAWRTPPANEQDTEAAAYRAARLGYEQRGAKFPHAAELSLVRDLPLAVVERVLPFVTVYSGRPQVNIMAATPKVLAAVPGVTLERLNAILALRQAEPANQTALLSLLGPAQQYVTTQGVNALRVAVRIGFDSGRQVNSEVVILVFEKGEKPFAVLSWSTELPEIPSLNFRKAGLQ